MSVKLYVGNLPYSTTEQDLQDAFARFGEVVSVAIIVERNTGRSKGFGFVEMNTKEEADEAVQGMNGAQLGGRTLKVNEAHPRRERDSSRRPRRRDDDW
jgi:RNA recognition motif-containing protein